MGKGLEWVDDARADAQAQVEQQVTAVGFCSRAGAGARSG
jgi:hypothetical protein